VVEILVEVCFCLVGLSTFLSTGIGGFRSAFDLYLELRRQGGVPGHSDIPPAETGRATASRHSTGTRIRGRFVIRVADSRRALEPSPRYAIDQTSTRTGLSRKAAAVRAAHEAGTGPDRQERSNTRGGRVTASTTDDLKMPPTRTWMPPSGLEPLA